VIFPVLYLEECRQECLYSFYNHEDPDISRLRYEIQHDCFQRCAVSPLNICSPEGYSRPLDPIRLNPEKGNPGRGLADQIQYTERGRCDTRT
jgi:hypothetical protein